MIKRSGAALVCLAFAASAHAGTVEVEAARCGGDVHIRAQDAPLGDVLAKAASTLGFRLDAKVALTEKVTLDRKGPPERLLKNLLQGHNLVIQTDPSKACGGQERITTVWVLPAGQDAPRPAPAAAGSAQAQSAAPVPPSPAVRPPRPRGTRKNMSEEDWQQMKQDYAKGRIKADPETGKPVPVEPQAQPEPETEAP